MTHMATNIYLDLTRQFNHGRLRAVLAGGQAMVLHRLAIMSKDGDWILREDDGRTRCGPSAVWNSAGG